MRLAYGVDALQPGITQDVKRQVATRLNATVGLQGSFGVSMDSLSGCRSEAGLENA